MSTRSSLLAQTGRALDGLRRFILNLVFFGILAALVVSAVMGRPRVPRAAALVRPDRSLGRCRCGRVMTATSSLAPSTTRR